MSNGGKIMAFRFLLLASLIIAAPIYAEEYEIEGNGEEAVDVCVPDEECEDNEVSYRCRRRYRSRRRCCCWRDIDASWPGKMDNSFMDAMQR